MKAIVESNPEDNVSIRLQTTYEGLRSFIVWLGLAETAWITYWLLSAGDLSLGYLASVLGWNLAILSWLVFVIHSGNKGFFAKHTSRFSNLVGVTLVVAFSSAGFFVLEPAREGLLDAVSTTSNLQLVSIHILRLLAIGTLVKYFQGQLPLHFVILGTLPDFVFAVSAVIVVILLTSGPLTPNFLIFWHIAGLTAFLGAGISMFFSVPSPIRIYKTRPDTSIVFQFPMLLAPNFTVPLFMLAHLFALVKLLAV